MPIYTIFAFDEGDRTEDEQKNIVHQFYDSTRARAEKDRVPQRVFALTDSNSISAGIEYVQELVAENKSEDVVITALGYGTGATKLLQLASQIDALKLPSVVFNIFAAAPARPSEESAWKIPTNVKKYVACNMQDDAEILTTIEPFKRTYSVDFNDAQNCRVFLSFPGNQTTAGQIYDESTHHTTLLIHNLAYHFLKNNKTRFLDDKTPSIAVLGSTSSKTVKDFHTKGDDGVGDYTMLEFFAEMKEQESHYTALAKNSTRSCPHLPMEFLTPAFFANAFEAELFKSAFPYLFNYLFEQGISRDFETGEEVKPDTFTQKNETTDLAELVSKNPKLATRLKKEGYIQENAAGLIELTGRRPEIYHVIPHTVLLSSRTILDNLVQQLTQLLLEFQYAVELPQKPSWSLRSFLSSSAHYYSAEEKSMLKAKANYLMNVIQAVLIAKDNKTLNFLGKVNLIKNNIQKLLQDPKKHPVLSEFRTKMILCCDSIINVLNKRMERKATVHAPSRRAATA